MPQRRAGCLLLRRLPAARAAAGLVQERGDEFAGHAGAAMIVDADCRLGARERVDDGFFGCLNDGFIEGIHAVPGQEAHRRVVASARAGGEGAGQRGGANHSSFATGGATMMIAEA